MHCDVIIALQHDLLQYQAVSRLRRKFPQKQNNTLELINVKRVKAKVVLGTHIQIPIVKNYYCITVQQTS